MDSRERFAWIKQLFNVHRDVFNLSKIYCEYMNKFCTEEFMKEYGITGMGIAKKNVLIFVKRQSNLKDILTKIFPFASDKGNIETVIPTGEFKAMIKNSYLDKWNFMHFNASDRLEFVDVDRDEILQAIAEIIFDYEVVYHMIVVENNL